MPKHTPKERRKRKDGLMFDDPKRKGGPGGISGLLGLGVGSNGLFELPQRRRQRKLGRRREALGMMPKVDQPPDLSFARADLTVGDLETSGGLLVAEQGKPKKPKRSALAFLLGLTKTIVPEFAHDTGPTAAMGTGGPESLIIPAELRAPGNPLAEKPKDALKTLFSVDLAQIPPQVQAIAMQELEKAKVGDVLSWQALSELVRVASAIKACHIVIDTPDLKKQDGSRRNDLLQIQKRDDEKQIVWGEVYIPGLPDSQGDFMTIEEVEKAAYLFMANQRLDQIDRMHDGDCDLPEALVVESFIARKDDPTFIESAWVVAVHVRNPEVWDAIKRGELNGFSLEGKAQRTEKSFELNLPEEITGRTAPPTNDHTHDFSVRFGEQGQFMGGETSTESDPTAQPGELHSHGIQKGTVTESSGANPHVHRYSISEAILAVSIGRTAPPDDLVSDQGFD